jgi:hypothetical protein
VTRLDRHTHTSIIRVHSSTCQLQSRHPRTPQAVLSSCRSSRRCQRCGRTRSSGSTLRVVMVVVSPLTLLRSQPRSCLLTTASGLVTEEVRDHRQRTITFDCQYSKDTFYDHPASLIKRNLTCRSHAAERLLSKRNTAFRDHELISTVCGECGLVYRNTWVYGRTGQNPEYRQGISTINKTSVAKGDSVK